MTAERWWETFFDDDYVTVWSAAGSFERTTEHTDGIEHLLQGASGNQVLDVACGFGRIAGQLQQRGYEVTGIDLSADQLHLAGQRNPGPTYLQRDMREPPAGPYDAVLNVYSSFGYFADRSDDIAALHRRLIDAGVTIVNAPRSLPLPPGGDVTMMAARGPCGVRIDFFETARTK